MKKLIHLIPIFSFALATAAFAGSEDTSKSVAGTPAVTETEQVPLDIFKSEHSYVFESDLNHGGSFGKQGEIQNELEYGHRIKLSGNFYAHVGFSYDRFDFGSTNAPVPNHLQSAAGIIGVDYMHGSDVGAFIQARPGFYTENDFDYSSVDVPLTAGGVITLQPDKLYVFVGAYAAFLRGSFPVLPLVGVVWNPCDHVKLFGVLPEPKLIYSPNKKLDFYLGAELSGGSYRTDTNNSITPHKLSGAQVDYTDYRAGGGVAYSVNKNFTVDLGAGVSVLREFVFDRAGENYRTDPAPFIRLELKAAF
ncbi:MAG: hypothetical protein H0X40_18600 [Chthoniobacterales bacterium]|nr:hypothetical protein [Chthoniobacterales bacterium]